MDGLDAQFFCCTPETIAPLMALLGRSLAIRAKSNSQPEFQQQGPGPRPAATRGLDPPRRYHPLASR